MGLYDEFKKEKSKITVSKLINTKYQTSYLEECHFIWKNYVPNSGQSKVLQGELLRDLEKLRWEAQNNGNMNWDEDFSYFCGFIRETLCAEDIFTSLEKEIFSLALTHIKTCGEYAQRYNDGKIKGNKVNANMIAYTEDNLYDIVSDAIGFFQKEKNNPIPFAFNKMINR